MTVRRCRQESMTIRRQKSIFYVRLSCLVILILLNGFSCSLASEPSSINLVMASPDPVDSGDDVTFQVVVSNTDPQEWPKLTYSINADIHDKDKYYLAKTQSVYGHVPLTPAQMTILYLSYAVPASFNGTYYYRVNLVVDEDIVATSQWYTFTVTPTASTETGVPESPLHGNTVLSFDQGSDGQPFYGMNANIVWADQKKTITFRANPSLGDTGEFVRNSINLTWQSRSWKASLGDTNPAFSFLTLSSIGVLGLSAEADWRGYQLSLVGGLSREVKEPDITSSGWYGQTLYGLRISNEAALSGTQWGVSVVTAKDDRNSLSSFMSAAAPQNNNVIGVDLSVPWKRLILSLEYAQSQHDEDIIDSNPAEDGSAYKATIQARFKKLTLNAGYRRVAESYFSLGHPGLSTDSEGYNASVSYQWNSASLSVGYSDYRDNVEKDPFQIATSEATIDVGMKLSYATLPTLSVNYRINDTNSEDGFINYDTTTLRLSSNYILAKLKNANLSLSYEKADFSDKVVQLNSISTAITNVKIDIPISNRVSMNGGLTYFEVKEIGDSSQDLSSGSASLGVNYVIFPQRITLRSGYVLSRSSNSSLTTNNEETSVKVGVIYFISSKLSLDLDYRMIDFKDLADGTSSYYDTKVSFRLGYVL